MKRINALISGEVRGVGYREEVKRIAFELNIYGWVRNLEDGRVEITAEGENRSIEEFLEKINIVRQDTAHIPEIRENTKIMLEKQDLHIKITGTGFTDVKEEIHKGFGGAKEEIHMLRDDFRELFMNEGGELRSEIAEVRATPARMQAG